MTKTKYYDKVKSPKQITLKGINVGIEIVAGDIRSIILTDNSGGELHVRKGIYSDIEVLVPGIPPTKTAYRLHGKALGLDVDITCQNKYDLETKKGNLEIKDNDAVLELVEVQIQEDEYDEIKSHV